MQIKKKLNKSNILYIIFFSFVLFINVFFLTPLKANTFKISDLEITEPFELNFDKEKVINRGFRLAFVELISIITTSGDKEKVADIPLKTIKRLIDSFTMKEERFIDNKYIVKFDVNFNKKNTLRFFEKKNIFPSIPQKKKLLLIPIFIDEQKDQVFLFNDNIFYEKWNEQNKSHYLLEYILPTEDIEDLNLLIKNNKIIEDYNFEEIIKKYNISDYIITLVYKNRNEVKTLSKLKLSNLLKINTKKYEYIDLENEKDFNKILDSLKTSYEDYWKDLNQINTSIKLILRISVDAGKHLKIKKFENSLNRMDLVSNLTITKFDHQNIYFKVIYNGTPNKFIEEIKKEGFVINNNSKIWTLR
jgi:hypothetical protein